LRHTCDTAAEILGHVGGTVEAMTKTSMTRTSGIKTSMTKTSSLVPGLIGLLLLTTACAAQPAATATPAGAESAATAAAAGEGLSKVLLIGDSIAVGEAVPLTEVFAASDVRFQSLASEGGGNVVGPFSDKNWQKLPKEIAAAKPSVVIYQITTFDWGSAKEQQAAYRKLLTTVTGAGAKLVFVTMPPIKPDDFYRPHMAELERAPSAARAVAKASSGRATVLDAGAVWGETYQRSRDGKPDRSTDGIHTCPQGAARFAAWLVDELAERFPGFTPAAPAAWANTGWADDKHFKGC
jgi:hypothetical protein